LKTITNQLEHRGQFINYNGKYWIVESYNKFEHGDGWFATPIYFKKDGNVEARRCDANWCYACNGAFLKDPELDIKKKALQNYLDDYLIWSKDSQIKQDCDTSIIDGWIQHFKFLIKQIESESLITKLTKGDLENE